MSDDIQKFSPLWGNWYLQEKIGKGSYGSVYKAVKEEYGNTYASAVKHISIPQEGVNAQDIIAEGYASDLDTVYRHYDDLRDKMVKEINVCYELRGHTNIVSYEDSYIVPKEEEKGYDIFIRMELLQSLKEYSLTHKMNEREVIKLGIDICEALYVLMSRNMMHRDIKPGNIFVNKEGNFKLGDFGEARILMSNTSSMSVAGTYPYMAPEVYRGENANITADIYSLGMVMYRMLNNGRAPFVNPHANAISSKEMEMSNYRRFKGEPFNPPVACGNNMLKEIILRACSFNSAERWQTPLAMKNALITVKNMIEDDDTISVQNIDKSAASGGIKNVSPYDSSQNKSYKNTTQLYGGQPQGGGSSQLYGTQPYGGQTYGTQPYGGGQSYGGGSQPYGRGGQPYQPNNNNPNGMSTSNKILIVVGILVAIALVATIVLVAVDFFGDSKKNSDDDDDENSTEIVTQDIESPFVSATETPIIATVAPTLPPTQPPTQAKDVKISSFKDVSYTTAKEELEKQGMIVKETYDYSFDVDEGKVISQSVKAGNTVKSGTEIELKISNGAYFSNVPTGCEQMLYVKSSGVSASMRLYDYTGGKWVKVFSCSATVGKNGVSSNYYEGQSTTPKGTFHLGTVLSQSKITDNMPWQPANYSTVIVEDVYSSRYNQIVDRSSLPSGTDCDNIGERLVNGTDNAAIFIEHNGNGYSSDGVVAGRCSSITICGHMSAIKATGGCIDISSSDMLTLLSKLDSYSNPYIRTE